MFISSKKTLLSQGVSHLDKRTAEEKLKSLEISALEIPHEQDMSDHPGYINKMFTVRADLSVSLCKQNKESQTTKTSLKCHNSPFHGDDIWRRLLPFKIEVLNNSPAIKLVHDFISHPGKSFYQYKQNLMLVTFL